MYFRAIRNISLILALSFNVSFSQECEGDSSEITFEIVGSSYPSEITYDVVDANSNTVVTGNTGPDVVCLANGSYTVNGYDVYADSWNGGIFIVTGPGGVIAELDVVPTGAFGSATFEINIDYSAVYGCTDSTATNYDPNATDDDDSCVFPCAGSSITFYMSGSGYASECAYTVYDSEDNIVATATGTGTEDLIVACLADGDYTFVGTDSYGDGWNGGVFYAILDDGSTIFSIGMPSGALAEGSFNLNASAVYGCTDPTATNYDPNATDDDGSCDFPTGCTDPNYSNYDPDAIVDDGSCYGISCPSPEYSISIEMFDSYGDGWGTAVYSFYGSDIELTSAGLNDGAYGADTLCLFAGDWIVNVGGDLYDSEISFDVVDNWGNYLVNGGVANEDYTFSITGVNIVSGCTDPAAVNYDYEANVDDGSCYYTGEVCEYPVSISLSDTVMMTADATSDNYYLFTAAATGNLTISSVGYTDVDTYLTVLSSCNTVEDYYGDLQFSDVVATSDDFAVSDSTQNGLQSETTICVAAGEQYTLGWLAMYDPEYETEFNFSLIMAGVITTPTDMSAEADTGGINLSWSPIPSSCGEDTDDGSTRSSSSSIGGPLKIKPGYSFTLTPGKKRSTGYGTNNSTRTEAPTGPYLTRECAEGTSEITFVMSDSWSPNECSYEVHNAFGSLVASSSGDATETPFPVCLSDGVYTVTGLDSWGDGWNGGVLTASFGVHTLLTLEMADGDSTVGTFTLNSSAVYGCTDPEANNYNPDATDDNGTCVYPGGSCEDAWVVADAAVGVSDISAQWISIDIPAEPGMLTLLVAEDTTEYWGTNNYFYLYSNCEAYIDDWTGHFYATGWVSGGVPHDVDFSDASMTAFLGTTVLVRVDDVSLTTSVSYTPYAYGCTDPNSGNYDPNANIDDGSCECAGHELIMTMYDSYGDGWNGATFAITNAAGDIVVDGTMPSMGGSGFGGDYYPFADDLCIPDDGDYTIYVADPPAESGWYDDEISWELSFGDGSYITAGEAPFGPSMGNADFTLPLPDYTFTLYRNNSFLAGGLTAPIFYDTTAFVGWDQCYQVSQTNAGQSPSELSDDACATIEENWFCEGATQYHMAWDDTAYAEGAYGLNEWFFVDIPLTGTYSVSSELEDNDSYYTDTYVKVYADTSQNTDACDSLELVAENDDDYYNYYGYLSYVEFDAIEGERYYIEWVNDYDPGEFLFTINDESNIFGCTDSSAYNFDPDANADDGSCAFHVGDMALIYPADGEEIGINHDDTSEDISFFWSNTYTNIGPWWNSDSTTLWLGIIDPVEFDIMDYHNFDVTDINEIGISHQFFLDWMENTGMPDEAIVLWEVIHFDGGIGQDTATWTYMDYHFGDSTYVNEFPESVVFSENGPGFFSLVNINDPYHYIDLVAGVEPLTDGDSTFWDDHDLQVTVGDCYEGIGDNWYSMDWADGDLAYTYFYTDCEPGTDTYYQFRVVPGDGWTNGGYEPETSMFVDAGVDTAIIHPVDIHPIPDQYVGITEAAGVSGDTVSVSVYADLGEGYPMNSFQVTVAGLGGGNISTVGVDTLGTVMGSDWLWFYNITDSGNVVITAGAGADAVAGVGTLFNVQFAIDAQSSGGFFPVFIADAIFNDDEAQFETDPGGVMVLGLGDVSMNGSVSAFDASLVLQHLVGMDTLSSDQEVLGDVTDDNSLSALDAAIILMYVVGLVDELPFDVGGTSAEGRFAISGGSVDPGEMFQVPIRLTDGSSIRSFEMDFGYDPGALVYQSITWNTDVLSGLQVLDNQREGIVKVSAAGMGSLASGELTLGWIEFQMDEFFNEYETSVTISRSRANERDVEVDGSVAVYTNATLVVSDWGDGGVPMEFALKQNYPNPFNPSTLIRYQLPEETNVTVAIYDIMGRMVRTLIASESQLSGYRQVMWNATNDLGQPVSAGMYIYTIQAGEFRQTRKMVLMK